MDCSTDDFGVSFVPGDELGHCRALRNTLLLWGTPSEVLLFKKKKAQNRDERTKKKEKEGLSTLVWATIGLGAVTFVGAVVGVIIILCFVCRPPRDDFEEAGAEEESPADETSLE